MFSVVLDLSDLASVAALGPTAVLRARVGMARAAAYTQQVWVAAVQGSVLPPMTRPYYDDAYAINIGAPGAVQRVDPLTTDIVCTYRRARKIEEGAPSYDMKPGLLRGPHSKVSKSGTRYNTVPFRHRTPLKPGQQAAPGHMQPPMPQDVYRIAKAGGTVRPGTIQATYGWRTKLPSPGVAARIHSVAAGVTARLPGLEASVMTAPYTWKTGLYTGIKRYGTPRQGRYMTFRRVSERSDPNSWIAPAVPPARIVEAVHAESARATPAIVRAAMGLRGAP